MEIPPLSLDPATLRAIIEEFVSREGTDYGDRDYRLEEKVAEVGRLIKSGHAIIVYDADSESCTIVPRARITDD